MKKVTYLLFLLAVAAASCKKDNGGTGIQPSNISVTLSYKLGYALPVKGVKVTITNASTGSSESAIAEDSVVKFTSVPAGLYNIVASVTFDAGTYTAATHIAATANVTFNAAEKSQPVAAASNAVFNLQLVAGTISDWVIKQVYYAGSNSKDGALYRDQFVELYNNSGDSLYADGIYFAQLWARQGAASSTYYYQSNGQLDWSKSEGMAATGDANNDYVYTRSTFRIPGSGKTYAVAPGKSIIIAQTAINHQAPYTGTDGKTITVGNPALTVNLEKADFETYYGGFVTSALASDVDNPAVPNMEVLQYYGKDMILDNPGRDAYVIFKLDAGQEFTSLPAYAMPFVGATSSTATRYYQLPIKYILDGVEAQPAAENDRIPKKLNAMVDAGFTFVPKSSYSSQSIVRKTSGKIGERIVLQDTNNSTEDFTYFDVATPWGFQ